MTDMSSIIPVNIEDEVSASYIDYAMSVIIGRALPDVRDGLKPVHRRILYSMHEVGNAYNRPYKKSARIVGNVIGKYHPHGDQAVYDALVRMAQLFNMRLPLIDGQGNFGSVDGDPPAAMRYTEVRLMRAAGDILGDLDKDTVDFAPNYDESESEPLVLPSRIPNLLVNGSEGIAVGMATRIPPHNLTEVVTAAIHIIKNPEATVLDLMEIVTGPDFPTGGTIYGMQGIFEAYTTGRGIIRIRAKAHTDTNERTDRQSIIVTELPFQVNKARLLEKIAALTRDKKIEGISDLRDESDRRGMRMVIELKKDAIAEIVLNQLYKMTPLQSSFGIIMLAIVEGRPRLLNLREVLTYFIDFRRDVVTRRCRYLLRKARAREHILIGLQIALDHIDEVIKLIRASHSGEEAKASLMDTFELSTLQAQAILDMRLQRLTGLERDKIIQELAEIQVEIGRLVAILADEVLLMAVIVEELEEVLEAYGTDRRSNIVAADHELSIEDLIADEEMVVTVSHAGYVKRTPLDTYRSQRRGGTGRTGMTMKEDDFIEALYVASTHTTILIFTTLGRVYKIKVHQLPSGGPTTRGRPVVNLLNLQEDEGLACVLPITEEEGEQYIVMATKLGTIKRTRLSAFGNIYARGIIAIKLREADRLIHVRLCEDGDRIFMAAKYGKSIQFDVGDMRPTGRDTMGVRGIRLGDEDECVGMEVIQDPDLTILTVTRNGFGKRSKISDYRLQTRGGKGVFTIKTTGRNGPVVGVRCVTDDDQLVMVTNTGRVIRTRVERVSVIGRNTQGVTLMKTRPEEYIAGVALLAGGNEEEENAGAEGAEAAETAEVAPVVEADSQPDGDDVAEDE
jgi:DNA gyrase subunit A